MTLNVAELDHLLTCLRDASQDGSYYGNRQQYRRRADRVWNKLSAEWEQLTGRQYPLRSREDRHG